MIRSTSHSIKFANTAKRKHYKVLLTEYRRVAGLIVDQLWESGYDDFNIKKDRLSIPRYLDYKKFEVDTRFTARALSSLVTNLRGVISAATEKRRRMLWLKAKLESEGKPTTNIDKKLHSLRVTKPNVEKLNPEFSSKNITFMEPSNEFEYWLRIKTLGIVEDIFLPLKATSRSNKWSANGKQLGSVMLCNNSVVLRFDVPVEKKKGGKLRGGDQGIKTVLTLSDGQATPETDAHGHSLESILNKIARKKRGSKAFRAAQAHRKNFINHSVNSLNFDEIGAVRLEKVENIFHARRVSRKMRGWTNTEIRDKVKSHCEEIGVLFLEEDSSYRSQRCSCCGNVRKANRKSKLYECKKCGNKIDADLNAAKNHEIELPPVPPHLRSLRKNLGDGFLWMPEGFFELDGGELRVPLSPKRSNFAKKIK